MLQSKKNNNNNTPLFILTSYCFQFLESSIEGYIHTVSPIKTATNIEKTKYFDCTMQVSDKEKIRLVCYSPKKRIDISEACQKKSPIKITGTKRMLSKFDSQDHSILKSAKITPVVLDFQYDKELSVNLLTVEQCLLSSKFTTVDLKVKIITKDDSKRPIVHNKQTKYKSDCIVADATQSMKLVLWEDAIDKVQVGKSYHLQNLKVNIFDDVKFVNSNESTLISHIEDIGHINLTSSELDQNIIKAQCIGIDIKKTLACIACNNAISDKDDDKKDDTITCPSCNITLLKTALKIKLVSQIILNNDGKITSYTCFNDAIDSFLAYHKYPDVRNIDIAEIKKLLLQAGKQQVVVDESQKLIYQFLPA